MNIGKAVKELRVKDAATQVEFAKSIGIDASYLSLIENGHKKPSLDVIQRIASTVDVPLAVLFWFGIERGDVSEEKQYAYDSLKPSIDNLITELFTKN